LRLNARRWQKSAFLPDEYVAGLVVNEIEGAAIASCEKESGYFTRAQAKILEYERAEHCNGKRCARDLRALAGERQKRHLSPLKWWTPRRRGGTLFLVIIFS
jgi:hypothetical protein